MAELQFIERSAYRPPAYVMERVELTFELARERTLIHSRLHLRRNSEQPADEPLILDGRDFEIQSAACDGLALEDVDRYRQGDRLILPQAGDECLFTATTVVYPADNRSQMGLFAAGNCLVTQCEADGFRRMTFGLDRPDVTATYRVRLEADAATFPVLLANGDCVAKGQLEGGRHYAVWDDPHPKPTYIFAVMAGNLSALEDTHVTASGREVALAIYAEPHHIQYCSFAMQALQRALAWEEAEYGLEYDLSHYSIVAIDDYTGAMENKGLNLFEAKGILADPSFSTDLDYVVLERILAHEVLHNWTGNRVTCKNWFELCLKEGLTRFRDRQFSAAASAPEVARIDAVAALRRNQFTEDDGGGAHPVKPTRYVDVQNLYTQTIYEKGAEVVRMLQVLLGAADFRRGVQTFLARFDGQAVTTEELLVVLEDISARDLGQFRAWYETAGRPRVRVDEHYDSAAQTYRLVLTQQVWAGGQATDAAPLHIPVAYAIFDETGSALSALADGSTTPGLLELTEREQTYVFEGIAAAPVISLFRGLSAPVTVEFERSDAALALLARHEQDAVARWDAAQTLARRIIRRISAGSAVEAAGGGVFVQVLECLFAETAIDPGVLARVCDLPDEPYLSDGLPVIALDGHMGGRKALYGLIAERLGPTLKARYRALQDDDVYAIEPDQVGRRALRNACLTLLTEGGDPEALQMCLAQVEAATNTNDAAAALELLCHHPCPERDTALQQCRARWQSQPLALAQWLKAIALGRAADAVAQIVAVIEDPQIELADPAFSMAFYGSFFRQNRVAFHEPSGQGYRLLADVLLALDRHGMAGAKWFMPQILQWYRYEDPRKRLMYDTLRNLADHPGISAGLAENVSNALRAGADS